MKLTSMICPRCGAPIRIPDNAKRVICEYCDSPITVEQTVESVDYGNAEEAGYNFEKGRMRAQAERPAVTQQVQYDHVPVQKKKRHTFWWVMGWIFIFPIPATILIVRSKKMPWWAKALFILLVWGIYLAIGMSGGTSAS